VSKGRIRIRIETQDDHPAVREVNVAAFGQPDEANLVDALRTSPAARLSLVAESAGNVVGHLFFSSVFADADRETACGWGLAPMAVHPDFQNRGIGTALVEEGLKRARNADCPLVVVVGHPEFYPRFGFIRGSEVNLRCQWDEVPDEAFMVQTMKSMEQHNTVYYSLVFDSI